MAETNSDRADLLPHGVILKIEWEIHQRLSDGKYAGSPKDAGSFIFDVKADNRALAKQYLSILIDAIKRQGINVSTNEYQTGDRPDGEGGLQTSRQLGGNNSQMFGMRGGLGHNPQRA